MPKRLWYAFATWEVIALTWSASLALATETGNAIVAFILALVLMTLLWWVVYWMVTGFIEYARERRDS